MNGENNKKAATLIAVDLSKTLITGSLVAFVATGAFLRFTEIRLCQFILIISMAFFIVSCFKGGRAIATVYKKANKDEKVPWNVEDPKTKNKFNCQTLMALLGLIFLGSALVVQVLN